MKMSPVFTLFSSLALCCFFLGVASKGPEEDECSEFFQSAKGKPFGCAYDYNPVCSTDNETYPNKCTLCIARRATGKDIRIKYEGGCKIKDVCRRLSKALVVCTKQYNPVCGTDGTTYSNLCMLCLARQETGKDIDVKHKGKCKEKDECSEHPEPAKGQETVCTLQYDPVCGSDGKTYGNLCQFCAAKRQSGGKLTIKHKGSCEKKDKCSQYPEPSKGQPATCPAVYRPVCGSDGKTYENLCIFCTAQRESGGKLTIKHEGACEQQENQKGQ